MSRQDFGELGMTTGFVRAALEKSRAALGIAAALLIVSPQYAYAETQTWVGTTNQFWSGNNNNWSANIPTATSDVVIVTGAGFNPSTVDNTFTINSLTAQQDTLVLAGQTVNVTSGATALTVNGGTIQGPGTINITGGGSFSM